MFSKRKREPALPFWQVPPTPTDDPTVLHRIGIEKVIAEDGRGMMSCGWAIWNAVGLNQFQASDFIQDGYRNWSQSETSPDEQFLFLWELLRRLTTIQPEIGSTIDVYSLPQHIVEPASVYYSVRCWAISEVLATADAIEGKPADLDEQLFGMLQTTNPAFMPPRTMSQFQAMCTQRGIPGPLSND